MKKSHIINGIIGLLIIVVIISFIHTREGFEGIESDGATGVSENIEAVRTTINERLQTLPVYSQLEEYGVSGISGPLITIPSINENSSTSTTYDYDHTIQQNNTIIFYGANNSTAKVTNNLGRLQISVNYGNGYTETYNYSQMYDDQIIFVGSGSNKAVMIKTDKSMTLTIYANGNTLVFYSNINDNKNSLAGYLNDYYYADGSQTSQQDTQNISSTPSSIYDYSSYLPTGITRSSIPPGKEDLYILKSEVVPPVCPVCPPSIIVSGDSGSSDSQNTPPCPACERCPEPVVDCKKVVKYKQNSGGSYGDYSTFEEDVSRPVQKFFNQFEEKTQLFEKGKNYKPDTSTEDEPVPLLNSFSSFGI